MGRALGAPGGTFHGPGSEGDAVSPGMVLAADGSSVNTRRDRLPKFVFD